MFYMETVYLQMEMAANRERLKEGRLSREDVLQQTGPHTGTFPNSPWRIRRWRGAGW